MLECEYYPVGSGVSIPALGLGTWFLTERWCTDTVRAALELGYTHIDTAMAYHNQPQIGEAIRGFDRDKLFITSKIFRDSLTYDKVITSAEQILRELRTEYVDLLLIHWPNKDVPIAETLKGFKALHDSGKAKTVGVSNFTIHHLQEALEITEVPLAVNQVEFHPWLYQKDLLEFCRNNQIRITAYSPFAHGKLFKEEKLRKIGNKYNKTLAQVCLRWLLQKGMVAIPKASSETHLKENMGAVGWELALEDMDAIDAMNQNSRKIIPEFAEF